MASEFHAADDLAPSPGQGLRPDVLGSCGPNTPAAGPSLWLGRGLQDGLGWGSKPGRRCACIRPPSQPSPCPGEGAFPACRRTHDLSRRHSFLRKQRAPTGVWGALKKTTGRSRVFLPPRGADDVCRRPGGAHQATSALRAAAFAFGAPARLMTVAPVPAARRARPAIRRRVRRWPRPSLWAPAIRADAPLRPAGSRQRPRRCP